MRVFIDTNVLISAALFPGGVAAQAYFKAVSQPYDPLISDYVIDELRRVFSRKFPQRLAALDSFVSALSSSAIIIMTPDAPEEDEREIRDVKDRPVLRAARAGQADILLTGDKDFLESSVDNPQVVSPHEFLLI